MKKLCFTAFDHGITHFDLANNYGPEPGSAEKHFGLILKERFFAYRDELLISTKAGYDMCKGPYGNWQPQVPDCQPGSEPATTGTRLCRYFFLSCRKEVPPVISVDREGFFRMFLHNKCTGSTNLYTLSDYRFEWIHKRNFRDA